MDNATPPSPVNLKTSSSVFSSFPSGTAQEIYNLSSIATHCKQKKTNTTTETFVKTTKKILLEINAGRRKMKRLYESQKAFEKKRLPNTNLSLPGPSITVSVARY